MKDKEIQGVQIRICNACKQHKKCDKELCTMSGIVAKELSRFYQLKLPEDSVVLSREEYEDYKKHVDNCVEEYHRGQHEAEVYYKNIQIPRERKETAEKIYLQAKAIVDATKHIVQGREYIHIDALKEIIKNCGGEIEE